MKYLVTLVIEVAVDADGQREAENLAETACYDIDGCESAHANFAEEVED